MVARREKKGGPASEMENRGGILYGLIYEECLLEVAGQLGKRGRERKGCSLGGMAERAKLSDAASVGNGHLPLRLWQLRKCSLIQKKFKFRPSAQIEAKVKVSVRHISVEGALSKKSSDWR